MRALVAGITGQLGHGLVEVADELGVEIVPLARPVRERPASHRVRRAFPLQAPLSKRAISGDVTAPCWNLDGEQLDGLADVGLVVNAAAETNWAQTASRLHRVNTVGAMEGLAVAEAIHARTGGPVAYVYASSIYVAGAMRGAVAERELGPDRSRNAYEHSKWLAEQALLRRPPHTSPVTVGIARMGGLLGNSVTGETARRHSLYLLADRWHELPWRMLPYAAGGRVDMLARDRAARDLWQAALGIAADPAEEGVICHVCAGERAPSARALFATLEHVDRAGVKERLRYVPVPDRALVWASANVDRVLRLGQDWQNTVVGARYLAVEREFERSVTRRLAGRSLEHSSVEEIVRLAFELDAPEPTAAPDDRPFARFGG